MLLMPGTAWVNPPTTCHMEAEFDYDQFLWLGTVTGDISGEIVITPGGTWKPGQQ